MTWMHFLMTLGYLVVLVAILVFFRGATLASREWEARRKERQDSEPAAHPARRAA
jgi:heme exporter protein D